MDKMKDALSYERMISRDDKARFENRKNDKELHEEMKQQIE